MKEVAPDSTYIVVLVIEEGIWFLFTNWTTLDDDMKSIYDGFVKNFSETDYDKYEGQEVDKFLDVIIGDYTKFIALVKRLDSEKKALIEDNLRLKKELREAQDKIELLKNTSSKEITNVDMLRRISMLEKAVFRDNDNNY